MSGHANAHPMDFAKLEVQVVWDELHTSLTIHKFAAHRLIQSELQPRIEPATQDQFQNEVEDKQLVWQDSDKQLVWQDSDKQLVWQDSDNQKIFDSIFKHSQAVLNGGACAWKSHLVTSSALGPEYIDLKVNAACAMTEQQDFSFDLTLPFLAKMQKSFQLATQMTYLSLSLTKINNYNDIQVHFDTSKNQSFMGFFTMGAAHIGAALSEWRDQNGFKLPEGLDHILFVMALVLVGDTLLGLLKCISGFTLGHSLTLGLSALKVIHIHSQWIEALIALSIATVAGSALFGKNKSHSWIVATVFGTIHGLGFASSMQELQLSSETVLPALFGFNLGVEVGQLIVVAMTLLILHLAKYFLSTAIYRRLHSLLALSLFLIGSFWFIQRAIN